MEVKFKKMCADAQAPTLGTDHSAGADLRAVEDHRISPAETRLVDTGIAVEIPEGYVGLLFPRSGLSMKTTLRMANSVGVIDSDYRGNVKVGFYNTGSDPVRIEKGDRIAQMVIVPYLKCEWVETDDLSDTARGAGGFGSTGVK